MGNHFTISDYVRKDNDDCVKTLFQPKESLSKLEKLSFLMSFVNYIHCINKKSMPAPIMVPYHHRVIYMNENFHQFIQKGKITYTFIFILKCTRYCEHFKHENIFLFNTANDHQAVQALVQIGQYHHYQRSSRNNSPKPIIQIV